MLQWHELIGHSRLVDAFAVALRKGRLSGSLLLVGPNGVGKNTTALLIARTLLCERVAPSRMAPCGQCAGCIQVQSQTHPDLIQVRKPDDKTLIPLELLIGPVEARLREGFCHEIHLRPMQGQRKVAILHDADFLNEEGANCLLKTLEEPPRDALIVLIGTNEQRQLPTIRSRCQIMRFTAPGENDGLRLLRLQIQTLIQEEGLADIAELGDEELGAILELAAGDFHVARRLACGQSADLRDAIVAQLSAEPPDPTALIRLLNSHLDDAGKDSPPRRAALRDACSIAIQHYRARMRSLADRGEIDPATMQRLDRTVRVFRELDRMANLNTLVECYAADLTLGTTGDRGGIG